MISFAFLFIYLFFVNSVLQIEIWEIDLPTSNWILGQCGIIKTPLRPYPNTV